VTARADEPGPTEPLTGIVDFHSHLMPGVDDGAEDVEHSIFALRAFRAQGTTTCITTPHFDGSLTKSPVAAEARLGALDAAWKVLQGACEAEPGLPSIERGVEVMLDEPDPDLTDPRLRLAGGPFVLCEFPAMQLPPNAEWALHNIRRQGWRPIIAHPERYRNHDARLTVLARCRAAGAHLQVNAGSLLGQHGERAQAIARTLLALGWVDYLASDYHARGVPSTARAVALLRERGAATHAHRLTVENPERILAGLGPLPVAPLEAKQARPWWARLFGSIRGG
jgi:protein-tyrosine phosphatase